MTLKQFEKWCNDRACDGLWSGEDARFCLGVLRKMRRVPFWKKRRIWKHVSHFVVIWVVEPVNAQIESLKNGGDTGAAVIRER